MKINKLKIGLAILISYLPVINIVNYLYPDFELMLLYPYAIFGYGLCMIGIVDEL